MAAGSPWGVSESAIMSLRKTFAANLARLCASKPSIAAVCRETKINRQQFNRYLSGAALPNDKNLRKICQCFDIDESMLFSEAGEKATKARDTDLFDSVAPDDIEHVLRLIKSGGPTSVDAGLYFADFAHPHDPQSIMRSVVAVRREGGLTTFRRLTGLSEKKRGSWWSHFNGDHRGFILERRHLLYFVALNYVGYKDPTQLVLKWAPNSDPILVGHASILTPIGPTVTAVVVTPCPPKTTIRSAIRASHVYSLDDPSIRPIILDVLDQQCASLLGMVRRLDLDVRPVPADPDQLSERDAKLEASPSAVASS